jgi:hypothetical protein
VTTLAERLREVLSLGAGVQSSTLALMAARGEVTPMPLAAIFADTQSEPTSVYTWLSWLESQLPFPVHRVTAGNLAEDSLRPRRTTDGRRYTRTLLPVWSAGGHVSQRSCTRDYKIRPIRRKLRELIRPRRGERAIRVVQWIGISSDEASRMKPAPEPWIQTRWPLVELGMTRRDCLSWMETNGYPRPPRSACVFCPFHSDAEWRRLKTDEPAEFAKAVGYERALQAAKGKTDNFESVPYLHKSAVPLDGVDFRSDEERGQLNMFENECEGMCGV